MDRRCPYVIEVELPGGKQTVLAVADAGEALAAMERTAQDYPDAVVMLYINDQAVLVHGPLKRH